MADIASLAIKLTANPSGFDAGITSSAAKMQQFGSVVGSSVSAINQSLQMLSANPIGAILGVVGAAIKISETFKESISGMTGEIAALAAEGEKWSNQQKKLGRLLGLTEVEAAGLQLQARQLGMDVSTLRTQFQAFSIRLGQAAAGSTEVTRALTEVGLSAQELNQMTPDEALHRIGEALNQVSNRGHRAQLTMQILGRRAQELEPLMNGGAAWGQAAQEQAQRWGLVVDEATQKTIKAATVARGVADSALFSVRQGIANAVAGAWAPVSKFMNDMTTGFIDLAQGPIGAVRDAIRGAGKFIGDALAGFKAGLKEFAPVIEVIKAALTDAWHIIKGAFASTEDMGISIGSIAKIVAQVLVVSVLMVVETIRVGAYLIAIWIWSWMRVVDVVKVVFRVIMDVIEDALRIAAQLPRALGGGLFSDALNSFRQMRTQTAAVGTTAATAASAATAATNAWARSVSDLDKSIASATERLVAQNAVALSGANLSGQLATAREQAMAQELRLVGMLNRAAALGASVREMNALRIKTYSQLNATGAQLGLLEREQRTNDLLRERQRILESFLTPLDKFQREMETINRLSILKEGALTGAQRDLAIGRAFSAMSQSSRRDVPLASGITAGSAQAISLINQQQAQGSQSNDPAERLRVIQAEALRLQRQQAEDGRRILEAIQAGQVVNIN